MRFSETETSFKHKLKQFSLYFANSLLRHANEPALAEHFFHQQLRTRVTVNLQTHEPKNTSSHYFSPT